MHAERVLSIINELLADARQIKLIELLDALAAAIEKRIKEHTQPEHDTEVANAANKLFQALGESRTHSFTPTWRKLVDELSLSILLAENIRARVDEAFESRRFDSELQVALTALKNDLAGKIKSAQQVQSGFKSLRIAPDELEPDEVEFNVAMPRESVDDQLDGFKKELDEFGKQLRVVATACKDKSSNFKIRNISTNDFSLAIDISVDLGEVLLFILIVIHGAQIDLRAKLASLEQQFSDLPNDLFNQFKEFANQTVKRKISDAIDLMAERCSDAVDVAALKQQRQPIIAAFFYLATLVQRGFNMDVRAGEQPEEKEGDAEEETSELKQLRTLQARLRRIGSQAADLKLIQGQTAPILSIEDASDHGDAGKDPAATV